MGGKDLGLVGLGVMGQNLTLNFQGHGYSVVVYNRTERKTRQFVAEHSEVSAAYSLSDLVQALDRPRRIFLMLTAGPAVDQTITVLTPHLSRGDVLMDGGNSFFRDTERRCTQLAEQGIHFLGVGVSGGEEGALKGPCLMVGGPEESYHQVSELLTKIAAQADGPCCQHLGPRGAGHYVKMVHNGIEYAVIEVIAEAYDILTRVVSLDVEDLWGVFDGWSRGDLSSFLLEIAVEVLRRVDVETGLPLVSLVLDRAGQKGTGRWASQNAMDLGVPVPSIDAAVAARNLSGLRDERVLASRRLQRPGRWEGFGRGMVEDLEHAVRASMIVSFAQGFHLMCVASREYGYNVPLREVARIWKGGCIIRARVLDEIKRALTDDESLPNLMMDPKLADILKDQEERWREAVKAAKERAIPIPAINASLDYYDAYRSERLPANLIQALRDRFGAHGYERVDRPGQFHTDWH